MGKYRHSKLHNRLFGLTKLIRKMLDEANAPGRQMSKRERADLYHILSIMNKMLMEDNETDETTEMPVKFSGQHVNDRCDFFDLDANRIQCAIGCDMYHCNLSCIYATNVPGTLPPYGTKYMKGWIER
jgi:hypothetical protein